MTKEEDVDVLKHNYPSAIFTDLCEAVDIAIRVLSDNSEPCQVARIIATIIENEKDMRVIATAQPELNSRTWVEFLELSFGVSRRTAKDMYHALCVHKARDNFRKQFEGGDSCKDPETN